MQNALKTKPHRLLCAARIFSLWLVLSACQVLNSSLPPTPTSVTVSLPLVMQLEPEETSTSLPLSIASDTPTIAPLPTETPTLSPPPQITLLFTGVIVPARCVQAAIDERGDANYIYDEVRDSSHRLI